MPTSERISVTSQRGHELAGRLTRVSGGVVLGGVVIAHCFTCSKDLTGLKRMSDGLVQRGYHTLRIDFTGLGESGGDFRDATFPTDVQDLVAASQWMIDEGLGPCAMLGHSLGGAAVLMAARRVRSVTAVVTVGAPADPQHVRHLIPPEAEAAARADGCATVQIAGRPFPITERFLDELSHFDTESELAGLSAPNLVLHAPEDDTVAVSEGEKIFAMSPQPAGFLPLPGADHLLTRTADAELVAELAAAWFTQMASS